MTSKFKQRLKRLHDSRLRAADAAEVSGEPRVFLADDALADAPGAQSDDKNVISGTKTHDGQGFRLITRRYFDAHHHGNFVLGASRTSAFGPVAGLTRTATFDGFRPEDIVYLDTETTGLSRDAYAFCVGIGFWQDQGFLVEQYVMHDANNEAAMLAGVAQRLLTARGLCTFNGRNFDVKLLESRFAHHGMPSPFAHLHQQHADLLPISRKQLKGYKSYRLSALEESVLGLFRVDDVPGKKIPPLWNRYLKTGQETLLEGVFEHNRIDIITMPVLLSVLLDPKTISQSQAKPGPARVQNTPSAQGSGSQNSGSVGARLKRSYALRDRNAKRSEQATPQTQPAHHSTPDDNTFVDDGYATIGERSQVLREAATILIARGQTSEALPMLFELAALAPENPFPLEHLARYYRTIGNHVFAQHFEQRLRSCVSF